MLSSLSCINMETNSKDKTQSSNALGLSQSVGMIFIN